MDQSDLAKRLASLSPAKRALLEHRLKNQGTEVSIPRTIPPRMALDSAPLSFAQQRLWFLDQLEPGSSVYNVPRAFRIRGQLNVVVLEKSVNEIVHRHDALRTTFSILGGQPVQIIAPSLSLSVLVVDLTDHPKDNREAEALRLVREEAGRPFDLHRGPLVRVTLLSLDHDDHILSLTMHHIVSDGWSMGVLYRELLLLYDAFSHEQQSPLPDLPVQYADFSIWQRNWLQGKVLESQLSYWKTKLEASPAVFNLPVDRPRPAVQTHRGARQSIVLSEPLLQSLKALSRKEGVTLFMTLLGAFQVLLHRYTGEDDIVIGTPIANRNQIEIESLIGFFVNTLVLRNDLSGDPTFNELLARVRDMALEAYAHQDVPFEKLVEELQPERSLSQSPLFEVMFALQNASSDNLEIPGLILSPLNADNSTAKFALTLYMHEEPEGLRGSLQYATDLFDTTTIERMLGHFQNLLEGIVANPEQRISELPLLTAAEKHQVLVQWNDTKRDYSSDKCIHDLFEAQVEKTPDAIALVFEDRQLTYRELNERASQLAHYLRKHGVGPEVIVGVCVDRSIEMIIGLLGVLKAGGAYLPLDPRYPIERLEFMLADAQVAVLLTKKEFFQDAQPRTAHFGRLTALASDVSRIYLDSDCQSIAQESDADPENLTRPSNLAYVIYTSGSTGQPKGVAIEHRNTVAFLAWAHTAFSKEDMSGVLGSTSIGFDLSVFEIFAPLTCGGTVILAENALALSTISTASKVSLINTVPSAMGELLRLKAIPASVRVINLAGEPLRSELVQRIYASISACKVHDLYGPTECTTYSTWICRNTDGPQSIGRPIVNTRIYILDGRLNPVPIGVIGEIYLGGDGVARGYLNRPELTAQKFITHFFEGEPVQRLYKTGDLGRYLPNGNIEFFGRTDNQIKVRGYRIELGEIEATLKQLPSIRESIVLAREDIPEDKHLVAYVEAACGSAPSANELRKFLRQKLPEYMVPAAFVFLNEIPLSPNGKIDRKALPKAHQSRPELDDGFAAPRTPVEEILANIWVSVLKLDNVGIHDNFFQLGGHSLLATQVVSRVNHSFQTDIPVRRLFESPTIADFANSVQTSMDIENDSRKIQPILPMPRSNDTPLSFAQERLWFLDRLDPLSPTYNIPAAFRLTGELNLNALEQGLNELVRRHEVLRTVFTEINGSVVQTILPPLGLFLTPVVLGNQPETEQAIQSLLQEEAVRPFDLSHGPLIRARLWRLTLYDHVLALNIHHIVSDGWSMGVLFRELAVLYRGYCVGEPTSLPDLPVQYADYSVWQRGCLQGESLEKQLSYWRSKLDGLSTLQLPTDHPRPVVQTYRGASESVELPAQLSQAIKTLSQREGVTLFMTLLAAFQALLCRYCGQDDIVVGSPIAGRIRQETEGLIGFFVNTLVLRADLSNDPTFKELLRQVRETTLQAYTHQDLPFEKLVEELNPERNPSVSPLCQVMFIFQNNADQPLELNDLTVKPIRTGSNIAKFDLSLTIAERDGKLRASLNYNTDLFDDATIKRVLSHWQVLLAGVVINPEQRISELPLLTAAEKHQLLVGWNDTKRDYPLNRCIHELFETQVEKTPDAIAVSFEDQQLTYGELNNRANQLAHYLRKHGVGPEVIVGVCVERSPELIIALLGVLKAGGAYVPLDPSYPQERLRFMLEDTCISLVLTDTVSRNDLPLTHTQAVSLDRDWDEIAREPQINPQNKSTAKDLAYVIYTSGSTGLPKGVEVCHRGIARLLFGVDYAQLDSAQTILQLAPISFDAATFEIWGSLLHGGKCVLFPEKVASPGELANILKRHQVSILWLTASLFNTVIDEAPQVLSEIKQLLIGGEALSVSHVKKGLAELSNTTIINGYGPTESTTFACCYLIPQNLDDSLFSIPIGKPIGNTQVYILDPHLNPVPIGVPGELHIGGAGLARGYLNRPELTTEKFIANPFSNDPQARLYKTGDLARYLPDGNIEFLGRIDDQVKIRGFRIELGEIEFVLAQHPAVQQAVVLAREDTIGGKRLVAYVEAAPGFNPSANELRNFLKQKLPAYMIPSALELLDELPLSPNGKVDRRALPKPDQNRREIVQRYQAPRTQTEEKLAGIWAQILGIDQVGIHDNFFDLGGHSLLAVRLFAEIEKTFGRRLPLRTIFQRPTIEQLANILRQQEWSESQVDLWSTYPSSVVPFQSDGSKTPLFWFSWGEWDFRLPRYLRSDQPVYGLQHQSQDGQRARHTSIEAMAAYYIKEIRAVQAGGPYFIGGYCIGGMVVFEMAQQLQKQGEEVALLVLLDPTNARCRELSLAAKNVLSLSSHIAWFRNKLSRHRRELVPLGPKEQLSYVLVRVQDRIVELRQKANWIWRRFLCDTFGYRLPLSLRGPYIVSIYERAARAYVPQHYHGRVILFKTRGTYRNRQPLYQSLVTEQLKVQELDIDHQHVLREPYVRTLAEILSECLSEATEIPKIAKVNCEVNA